ncbi:MAG TPA: hypothetical protein VNL15_06885 [Dehalococcoidia bacterium]|nr:hypothetical protein [Dehalococcoidia bacterium]
MAIEIIERVYWIGANSSRLAVHHTVIQRDGKTIAALAPGDPFHYLLRLPLDQLNLMRSALKAVFQRQPEIEEIIKALIEYRSGASSGERAEVCGPGIA